MAAGAPAVGSATRLRAARVGPVGAVMAAVFLVAHLPFLASTLEDIDSVNFALGIHEFDPAKHQPHPPGYPIFMVLAKAAYAIAGRDATALAIWGAVFGALAAFPLLWLFISLESPDTRAADRAGPRRAIAATIAAMTAPLFWFTASRPMSDVAGLAFTLAAQATLVAAFMRQRRVEGSLTRESILESGRLIVLGAFLSAIALGFRAQAGWLTVPLLIVVILDRTGRGAAGAILGSLMTFAIGVLAWGAPLVIATGGWSRYLGALGAQAGEDIGGVDLLVSTPTIRHLAADLQHTFIRPWALVPFAIVVLALAVAGSVALLVQNRRAVVAIAAAAIPYTAFHLLFQETVTVRYALPLVPFVAYLAVRGIALINERLVPVGAAALAAVSLMISVPAVATYAREGSPVARAVSDLDARGPSPRAGALAMHYAFVRPLRRTPPTGLRLLETPPKLEWLALVNYWREGNRAPVWFLADPYRTDLALIDPASQRQLQRYAWSIPTDRFLSGIRPDELRWIQIAPPGWFLDDGWALTPETAGAAAARAKSPALAPIVGYVRRRTAPSVLVIGGRNLGALGDPDVRFTTRIDGRVVDEVVVKAAPGFFLRMIPLAGDVLAGGAGDYAALDVSAAAADGSGHSINAAIEQFDLQPEGSVVVGFDTGWHELEYSPALRHMFRWSSARADLLVHHAGRDVTLHVTGESPLRYFDGAPTVTIAAGDRSLAQFTPNGDFNWTIRVPAEALTASKGRLTLATTRTFVPAERSGSPDRRQLGLRVYSLTIE